jgi:hypothetical protein
MAVPFIVLISLSDVATRSMIPHVPPSMEYRDYSHSGADYNALQGILLKATSVTFDGVERAKVLGTSVELSKYSIVAPIEVQTSCNYVSGTFETAIARYTLSVAIDPTDAARREFVRQIRAYWKAKDEEELRDYKYMPATKFLWMKSGRYVLYSQPDDELPGATYLFYTAGKVIRLRFDDFQSGGGGWGGISTFVGGNLRFKFPDAEIGGDGAADVSPSQFSARDKSGYFNRPPKA